MRPGRNRGQRKSAKVVVGDRLEIRMCRNATKQINVFAIITTSVFFCTAYMLWHMLGLKATGTSHSTRFCCQSIGGPRSGPSREWRGVGGAPAPDSGHFAACLCSGSKTLCCAKSVGIVMEIAFWSHFGTYGSQNGLQQQKKWEAF